MYVQSGTRNFRILINHCLIHRRRDRWRYTNRGRPSPLTLIALPRGLSGRRGGDDHDNIYHTQKRQPWGSDDKRFGVKRASAQFIRLHLQRSTENRHQMLGSHLPNVCTESTQSWRTRPVVHDDLVRIRTKLEESREST